MIKLFVVAVIFFASGFLSHALFFPDILTNGITDVSQMVIPQKPAVQGTSDTNTQVVMITFDGEKFSRHNITIPFSRYLKLTNESTETLMWLESNTPLLSTNRGYGYKETLEVRMDQRGQFVLADKNNPNEKVIITVK